jgi:hypothetical protein
MKKPGGPVPPGFFMVCLSFGRDSVCTCLDEQHAPRRGEVKVDHVAYDRGDHARAPATVLVQARCHGARATMMLAS